MPWRLASAIPEGQGRDGAVLEIWRWRRALPVPAVKTFALRPSSSMARAQPARRREEVPRDALTSGYF